MATTAPTTVTIPLNRVEGDLEVRVEVHGGVVTDAWSAGTMYRGFERILVGRGALDGLVVTPRVCGLCSTAHLTAASRALDMIAGAAPPPGAVRIRNVALMVEHLQSDMRHMFLMAAADFTNAALQENPLFPEAVRRFAPFAGETAVQVLQQTKKLLEVIAILGGQWPHSCYMVPGGIVSVPSAGDLLQCRHLLRQYRDWYERRILGCSLERWGAVRSAAELDAWLDENAAQHDGDLGFFVRFARAAGLDRLGRGHGNFLSFGACELPDGTRVRADGGALVPAGFARGADVRPFDQAGVAEHIAFSWYTGYEGGRHPSEGETRPYATGEEGRGYSWAKAPRYDGLPAETGPLAELVVGGDPLVVDLLARDGPSIFLRELARIVRGVRLIPAIDAWLAESTGADTFYRAPEKIVDGEGFGLTQATRGALGHWVRIEQERIQHYQIITPTAWNASPRDAGGGRGPIEEALIGTPVRDADNPVEVGMVVRSYDPCLVCTVHTIVGGTGRGRRTLR